MLRHTASTDMANKICWTEKEDYMGNYVFEWKNLNIDDSSLKAFATSVFNHIYPDVVDVKSERQKYEMMVHVHTMLRCIIPETGIDYERLLLRFKDELGDLMYHMWDQDCQMATPNFLREDSQEFFNSIVYDYIHVHYRELMEQARRSIPEPAEGTFSYGDYTFVPYREYTSDEKQKDLRQLTDKFQLRSDPDLGMSKYPGNKAEYDWNSFIDTANKSGSADIFYCRETDRYYIPGENEMFWCFLPAGDIGHFTVHSWADMEIKYPDGRGNLSEENEKSFVEDCFKLYERKGFADRFWTPFVENKEYIGMSFYVRRRTPAHNAENSEGADLECLPMWDIEFENGTGISAYPEEIIPSVMKDYGCPEDFWRQGTKEQQADSPACTSGEHQNTANGSCIGTTAASVPDSEENFLNYIIEFAKDNNWDYENVPEQIRSFFTTWCFLYKIDADTRKCDKSLNRIHWEADLEELIPFEEFVNYMVKLIV